MPLWTLNEPPKFKNPKGKPLVATKAGWTDPDTGEVLVAISNLTTKAGAADVVEVRFGAASYSQGDPISVIVRFNERVDVTAGAVIQISSTGTGGNFDLHAAAQTNSHEIVFDKQADNTTPETVPLETAILSLSAQTVSGTIVDTGTAVASTLTIDADEASSAGTRSIA